jgi:phosphoenolpyruvate---glycerone phosphotransferase subunit DhaK
VKAEEDTVLTERRRRGAGAARVKKFLNDPEAVVSESLAGLGAAHPTVLTVDLEHRIVLRRDRPVKGKVAVLSGGGAGHEPLHGGFVGFGMLDAACPGAIFTSPSPDQILAATKAVAGDSGVVYIVKNYTGDVMNFRLAAELAEEEGIAVESVLIDDDVATEDSLNTVGRRGTGVTVLAEKMAGARAEAGGSLAEVAAVARHVNAQGRSFGVALTSCAIPATRTPTFELGLDEMEFGVGIHGEAGRRREKLGSAAGIVRKMTDAILEHLKPEGTPELLALVSGLGGTPLIELYLIYNELTKHLAKLGLRVARSLVGNYVTSLEMAGVSITLLKLDQELTELWDAPVHTPPLNGEPW